MWRRIVSSQLQALTSSSVSRSASRIAGHRSFVASSRVAPTSFFARHFSFDAENVVSQSSKRVEDILPIATGHEREELQAELEGRDILEINHPVGPFGTKVWSTIEDKVKGEYTFMHINKLNCKGVKYQLRDYNAVSVDISKVYKFMEKGL